MAFGENKVLLIGRLGDDVAINHLASGGRVANMSIATDESYIDRQTGERVDRTEWHRCVTFQNGLVDMLEKHAKKGRLIYVAGKLQTRRWRRPGAGARTARTPTASRPRSCWSPAGACQFLDKPANGNGAQASNGETRPRVRHRRSDGSRTDEIPF